MTLLDEAAREGELEAEPGGGQNDGYGFGWKIVCGTTRAGDAAAAAHFTGDELRDAVVAERSERICAAIGRAIAGNKLEQCASVPNHGEQSSAVTLPASGPNPFSG